MVIHLFWVKVNLGEFVNQRIQFPILQELLYCFVDLEILEDLEYVIRKPIDVVGEILFESRRVRLQSS